MSFIPNNMPQSGSQWRFGAPGLGSPNWIENISPSALSFSQGPLDVPRIDTSQMVTTPNVSMGGVAGAAGNGLNGFQIGSLALGGLQTLGGLYAAFQANKLAKKQFNFTRDFSMTNLRNSTQDYNTKLEDRIRSRSFTEGREPGYADAYIEKNKLSDQLASFGKGK